MRDSVSIVAMLSAVLPICLSVSCAAELHSVDGYDAEYVDTPPVNVELYPRYEVADGYVYEVNGRYYHRHGTRWVRYHSPPRPELRRGNAERIPEHRR